MIKTLANKKTIALAAGLAMTAGVALAATGTANIDVTANVEANTSLAVTTPSLAFPGNLTVSAIDAGNYNLANGAVSSKMSVYETSGSSDPIRLQITAGSGATIVDGTGTAHATISNPTGTTMNIDFAASSCTAGASAQTTTFPDATSGTMTAATQFSGAQIQGSAACDTTAKEGEFKVGIAGGQPALTAGTYTGSFTVEAATA